jgi:hypothetical protein
VAQMDALAGLGQQCPRPDGRRSGAGRRPRCARSGHHRPRAAHERGVLRPASRDGGVERSEFTRRIWPRTRSYTRHATVESPMIAEDHERWRRKRPPNRRHVRVGNSGALGVLRLSGRSTVDSSSRRNRCDSNQIPSSESNTVSEWKRSRWPCM